MNYNEDNKNEDYNDDVNKGNQITDNNKKSNNNKFIDFCKCIKNFDIFNFIKLKKNDKICPNQNKDLENKYEESFKYYCELYKNNINDHIENPENNTTIGLINLLNDCYIITFLQILFHTPNFLNILKKYNYNKGETIINYLILVSEYRFNVNYVYKLKKLFGDINLEYSKPYSNDSQEFGIDLINYLISQLNRPIDDNYIEVQFCNDEELIDMKKKVYKNFISIYQKNINEIENLFLFNQIDIFCKSNNKKPKIFANLHIELTLQKMNNNIKIEELLENKYNYNFDNININSNQIIIKSKLANLPNILIISINRALNNEALNNSYIIFEERLDLKQYIDNDLYINQNNITTYRLYAINECFHSFSISHYKCSINIKNKWYIFDDNNIVKEISHINKNSNTIVGLFYIRDDLIN